MTLLETNNLQTNIMVSYVDMIGLCYSVAMFCEKSR